MFSCKNHRDGKPKTSVQKFLAKAEAMYRESRKLRNETTYFQGEQTCSSMGSTRMDSVDVRYAVFFRQVQ